MLVTQRWTSPLRGYNAAQGWERRRPEVRGSGARAYEALHGFENLSTFLLLRKCWGSAVPSLALGGLLGTSARLALRVLRQR